MKKLLLYTVFIFSAVLGFAQTNLVPNPSFEDTTSCPLFSNIAYATGWENYGYSPDCYNSCSNSNSFGIPYNWVGQQNAYNGNGYAGIVTFDGTSGSQREVIGTQLTQNLTLGVKYFVSGYISRADSVDNPPHTCAANKFGFKFSTIPFLWSFGNYAPINNFAHVYSNSIISNKTGWTKISGSFIADSTYQYIMVGNFFDNANTDTLGCNYTLAGAYYYVDDICVSTDSLTCNLPTSVNNSCISNIFSIYPNPTKDILYIKFSNNNSSQLFILDPIGQVVLSQKLNDTVTKIDLSFLKPNLYFLKTLYNNQFYHYKLLKQ